MAAFMDENFLLKTPAARKLFFDYASQMPIIDYHCHLSPQEIYENRGFENLTQAWLGGDHYKWRLMRAAGVEEKYITGDARDREKFQKYAEVLSRAIGNPLYHWSHLELQRFFDWKGVLRPDTAQEVWDLTCEKLKDPEMVLPAWRPDQAMNIEKRSFTDYIEKLSEASGVVIKDFDTLLAALDRRMEFFHAHGCRLSDHGLPYAMYAPLPRDQEGPTVCKMQHGSAWWFNDQKQGMEKQLTSLANKGYLAGFVGMLTDSRSFLSYPRHEYFRRILCNLIGGWIEDGEYPADFGLWGKVVQDISYNNAHTYFRFPE